MPTSAGSHLSSFMERGPERAFFIGWFIGIALWPIRTMQPLWNVTITRSLGLFGLVIALFAALALLFEFAVANESHDSG